MGSLTVKNTRKPVKGAVSTVHPDVAEAMAEGFKAANDRDEYPVTAEYPNGFEGYEGVIELPLDANGEFALMGPDKFMAHARAWGMEQDPKLTVSKVGRRDISIAEVHFDFSVYNPDKGERRGRPTDAESAAKHGWTDVEAWKNAGRPKSAPEGKAAAKAGK